MGRETVHIPEKKLRRLYLEEKLPMSKIAEKFNCSRATVAYKMKKYEIKTRSTSEAMKLAIDPNEYKIEIPENELIKISKGKAKLSEIAKKYDCAVSTVQRRAREHGIKLNLSKGKEVNISKKELEKLYQDQGLGTQEIAEKYGCCKSTITKKLHKYNIEVRSPGPFRNDLSKEKLKKLYIDKRLSTWKIEEKYGYPRNTVHRKLKKYGIETRSKADANIKYPRKDFDGDKEEKAYLIGFAFGDLRARKRYENSKTINVDCGSTKKYQIELIENLFKKYGKIWKSKQPNRKTQIETFLNLSFSFLLDTKKRFKNQILNEEGSFVPFLAGFTDADGCTKIHNGKAVYQLGNYDNEILSLIQKKLKEIGIKYVHLYRDDKRRCINKEKGYFRNQSYFQLHLTRKFYLLKLLNRLDPYLRHKGKNKDLEKAKENIKTRNKLYGG